jgi:hypothetical protein
MEIQKADPAARKRGFLLVSAAIVLGLGLLWLLGRAADSVDAWLNEHAAYLLEHLWVVWLAFFVPMLPIIAGAAHVYRIGARTVSAERYPPPGQPVVRDTLVIAGAAAIARGRMIQALAVVLIVASVVLPAVVGFLLTRLAAHS